MARLRYEAQRRLSRRQGTSRTLESQLNPEAELELSQQRRASLVPAETLYTTHCHGILRREGTNALKVLRDTRWNDDRSIIGTMEVDLSEGTQLVYIAPNLLISVEDFYHHIEIAIQTHGYEQWNSAESNLLITRGLIGRLTNTSHAGFRYNIQNVADYLASTGINAVPATPRTTAELQGMRWILQPPNTPQIRNPQAVRIATLLDGSISLAFSGYRSTGNPRPSNYNERDTEDIHEEFAGVFLQELGMPDTNDRCDTLGEPTGRYNFYVNYAAPPPVPFIPPTKPYTPWEEDPEFDSNELAVTQEDDPEDDDPESYYLGLQNQELDYPVLAPIQEETDHISQSEESEQYWQQVVQHMEQIEDQLPTQNGWHNPIPLDYSFEDFIDRIPEGISPGV
ncbi:hypothetical protein ZIOFF_001236 [Zingiber officinale]|uniref:Uncharacterized protein n=1 Tax=Zingiber officinale TaxID=94328 RepID=A0A8J5HYC9_ZINOF|nr:hypothetical protein ZIOFF_001236 [Zingiber officinale]